MGPCGSTEDAAENWDPVEREIDGERVRTNKATGEAMGDDDGRPESDFFEFEAEEVKEGQEFLSVKPWKAVEKIEPDNHPEVDKSKPDTTYALEYAYGYRCQDSRMSVYYNPDGNICYMTAALGVILDKTNNT